MSKQILVICSRPITRSTTLYKNKVDTDDYLQMQKLWICLFVLISGGFAQYLVAPRSASENGSKRMLNSYAIVDGQLTIIEYNEDLSQNASHEIKKVPDYMWDSVKACDQYYLVFSTSVSGSNVMQFHLITLPDGSSDLTEIIIPINTMDPDGALVRRIAVAPSGRNFVFFNGSHFIVYEVELKSFNWTIVAEQMPSWSFSDSFVMSDTQISFLQDFSGQYIYNYKTNTVIVRNLPTTELWPAYGLDTYNDYWVCASKIAIFVEHPNGSLQVFNNSLFSVGKVIILPPQLSSNKDNFDIAMVSQLGDKVVLGRLNTMTNSFEAYNILPSKSLGLEYKTKTDRGEIKYFIVSYNGLMYQLPDINGNKTVAISLPSSYGNHSCSMDFDSRMSTYWCSWLAPGPTDPCPKGTYQPSTGYTACLLCPEGTYQPHAGSVKCLACKDHEYCPLGTIHPEVLSNMTDQGVSSDFPIPSETTTSFEEILLMLLFASSSTSSHSISVVLLGSCIIVGAMLISLLIKYACGISLHWWLAKIDIHKKTKYKNTPKPDGTLKIEAFKVESVFGGFLTLLAAYILLVGLITTITYVTDYHPLLIGEDNTTSKSSQNSFRTSSLQDYNTQSKASELANAVKDNLSMNITIVAHNIQTTFGDLVKTSTIQQCFDRNGHECPFLFGSIQDSNGTAVFIMTVKGPMRFTETNVEILFDSRVSFTFATVEVSFEMSTKDGLHRISKAKYYILPGVLLLPVTMTVVVRETELASHEFVRDTYMSFISDTFMLHNMGQSVETFETSNAPLSLQIALQLDNNWRLESEQRRFGGVGAFFAALLAILGLYEVTLLASELAHRIFHTIEKRSKKRSKYHSLEDPPLIVNEKIE